MIQPVTLVYLARAVTPGTCQVPQPMVESMYVADGGRPARLKIC
ncbi:hypothetical protein ACLK1T_20820 [Escherichia coli]